VRAIFFTKDGLRSVPEEIYSSHKERPPRHVRRPCMEKVTNVSYVKTLGESPPTFTTREYEFSKFVEWFDGDQVAYYCEI
jgi:hypothetical protein